MDGWDLSDKLAVYGLLLAAFGIVTSIAGAHYHSALRDPDGRDTIVADLQAGGWASHYHGGLAWILGWLERRIGLPPFAREAPGKRQGGLGSLNVCIAIAYGYSILAFLIAWVVGAPRSFGLVVEVGLLLAWLEPPFDRLAVAVVLLGFGVFMHWWLSSSSEDWGPQMRRRFGWPGRPGADTLATRAFDFFVGGLGFYAVVGTVILALTGTFVVVAAGAIAGSGFFVFMFALGGAVRFAYGYAFATAGGGVFLGAVVLLLAASGAGAEFGGVAVLFLLFWFLLPLTNGFLDWISLSASRWFGRGIVAEGEHGRGWPWALLFALADLVLAVLFLFGIAWLLAFGVEATGLLTGVDLALTDYIQQAAADPWVAGLWATFMILSTLFPTAVHFALAIGAVLMSWFRSPIHRWVAAHIETGNQANFLLPTLFLTLVNWVVPLAAACFLMIYGLDLLSEHVWGTLPHVLEDVALDGIQTAQAWFG